jgi:7-dehydrocholesterol reductase
MSTKRRTAGDSAANGSWRGPDGSESRGGERGGRALGASALATFLVSVCPVFAMVFIRMIVEFNGDLRQFAQHTQSVGVIQMLKTSIFPYVLGSRKACQFIIPFAALQLLLMRLAPGKITKGPVTPAGNIPTYKANGLLSFFVTLAVFCILGFVLKVFDPAEVYDHYQEIIGTLNLFSLLFCLAITLKGRFFPSSTDSGASGNLIFDYYWGTELYPRVLGWDIKMFTNCRFGMMSWGLFLLSYAAKQHQMGALSDSMVVAVTLQLLYITKFFQWEMGYMKSLDIMHDRAGFMLCWGCMVWVPSVYTSHTLYLTTHPNNLGLPLSTFLIVFGALCIFFNYDADHQRELVRNTDGDCTVWGRKPEIVRATYHTSEGKERKSILLVSGWWGVARHFHYVPEIIAAFLWTVPALFQSWVPYFYVTFLVILLTHRAIRDDVRCAEKYGKFWNEYCKKVPYKIIPFIF